MNAVEIAQLRAAQAMNNRAAMPTVTALLDELRRAFPGAKVRYATEAGAIVGRQEGEGVAASDSGHYITDKLIKLYRRAA